MNHLLRFPVLALACLLTVGGASAHNDAYLDTQQAPHGGQLRMAGSYHFELVLERSGQGAAEKTVLVYLTDHAGQEIDSAGAQGSADMRWGKRHSAVALVPDGGNRLKGTGAYAATPDLAAVVSIVLDGQPPEQARFTPTAGRPGAAKGRHAH